MLDARPATPVCFFSRESEEGALFSPPDPPSSPPGTTNPMGAVSEAREVTEERRSLSRRARA